MGRRRINRISFISFLFLQISNTFYFYKQFFPAYIGIKIDNRNIGTKFVHIFFYNLCILLMLQIHTEKFQLAGMFQVR